MLFGSFKNQPNLSDNNSYSLLIECITTKEVTIKLKASYNLEIVDSV